MPYDKTTGIITKPLNTWDIGLAVNSSSNNVDTLCEAPGINKWAKFKPIRYPKYGELTLAERQSKNFGLEYVPYYTSMKRMVLDMLVNKWDGADNYQTGMTPWDYARPRGAEYNEPHRMPDFDGYYAFAGELSSKPVSAGLIRPGDGFWVRTTLCKNNDYQLHPKDMQAIGVGSSVKMKYIGIGYIMGAYCSVKVNRRLNTLVSHETISILSTNYPMKHATYSENVKLFVVLSDREIDYDAKDITSQVMPDPPGTFIPIESTISTSSVEIMAILVTMNAQMGWDFIYAPDESGHEQIVGFRRVLFDVVFNGTYEHTFKVRVTKDDGTLWAEAVYAPIVLHIQDELYSVPFELEYRSWNDSGLMVPSALLKGNENIYTPVSLTGTINSGDFWETIGREQIIITDRYHVAGSTDYGEITTVIVP